MLYVLRFMESESDAPGLEAINRYVSNLWKENSPEVLTVLAERQGYVSGMEG